LLAKLKWFKRRAFANHWVKHAHLRLGQINDLARKIEWCAANDMEPISRANRRFAEAYFDRARILRVWSEFLAEVENAHPLVSTF
jgi:hypothetical protein